MAQMADLIPFWKIHNLNSTHPKIVNNSLKCSVSNPLQVYVILESCIFKFGAVVKNK